MTTPIRRGAVAAVLVLLAAGPARAEVPGPLKVSANGRHFVDRAGKPFFWLGDTGWPLLNEFPRPIAGCMHARRVSELLSARGGHRLPYTRR